MGTMSMRLLRPIHPFVAYAASHIAAMPFRAVDRAAARVILLLALGRERADARSAAARAVRRRRSRSRG